jgi:hypothetical protein
MDKPSSLYVLNISDAEEKKFYKIDPRLILFMLLFGRGSRLVFKKHHKIILGTFLGGVALAKEGQHKMF